MDPQKLSQLDPKLRDAYQRIMGTPLPDAPTVPASPLNKPVDNPAPIPEPQAQPEQPITSTTETPLYSPVAQPETAPMQQVSNPTPISSTPQDTQVFGGANFPSPIQAQSAPIKTNNNLLTTVAIGIAILVFFVVYTLFWTKIFNLKLPF